MNPLDDMYALRHEDCNCEECLLKLEEEYDKMAEDYKRAPYWDETYWIEEDSGLLRRVAKATKGQDAWDSYDLEDEVHEIFEEASHLWGVSAMPDQDGGPSWCNATRAREDLGEGC